MIKKKKNGFWTFIFSFLPGAAEMYMGFMKTGISLLTVFLVASALCAMLEAGPLLFVVAIVWFYGFFHARNMAGMSEEQLQATEDKYLFVNDDLDAMEIGKKYKKLLAAILILIGVVLLWNSMFNWAYGIIPGEYHYIVQQIGDIIPKIVIAVIVIIIGFKMIAGKKEELNHDDTDNE